MSFSRSSATSTVISFVIDAIAKCPRAADDASTSPVSPFSTSQACACGGAGGAAVAVAATSAAASEAGREEEAPHRRRMRSPMKSEVGSTFGFSCSRRATETPVAAEIVASVSPARTR